jgi:hypothetical protein
MFLRAPSAARASSAACHHAVQPPSLAASRITSSRRAALYVYSTVSVVASKTTPVVARLPWRHHSSSARLPLIDSIARRLLPPRITPSCPAHALPPRPSPLRCLASASRRRRSNCSTAYRVESAAHFARPALHASASFMRHVMDARRTAVMNLPPTHSRCAPPSNEPSPPARLPRQCCCIA